MTSVSDALAKRRSVRAFLDIPVDRELMTEILRKAARAPSGGNLQPWHIDLVTGRALAELKVAIAAKIARGAKETPAYQIYPSELRPLYRKRRSGAGEAMYQRLGIVRADREKRHAQFDLNFQFFGAPVAMFCTVDRQMGPPQWADLGMYLQSVMLLVVEAGLASCAQESWALFPETVTGFLGTPSERMLFCGMAVGYEDREHPINRLHTHRAPDAQWLTIRN